MGARIIGKKTNQGKHFGEGIWTIILLESISPLLRAAEVNGAPHHADFTVLLSNLRWLTCSRFSCWKNRFFLSIRGYICIDVGVGLSEP